jgi:LPXTG-motif cell wall-anchored protein
MTRKLLTGVAVGLASVALVATPSFAAPTSPGELETINSSGGTSATDGLKIDVAFGNIQIGREGGGQLFWHENLPLQDVYAYGRVKNFPVVALSYGTSPTNYRMVGSPSTSSNAVSWTSFTSESALTDSGRSGTVINHLTYGSDTSLVTADFTISYTYPNQYFNVKFDLTGLGSDYSGGSHRLYWFADSYLGGSDRGFQFGGTTPGGQAVAGVYNEDGSLIEAFRQVAGQNLDWFAGQYECPYKGGAFFDVSWCGVDVATGGFTEALSAFPNTIATKTTPIDNGFGVSSALSTAATDSMTFDLIFDDCVATSPLPCADGALGTEPAPGTEATPSLPNTGVDTGALAGLIGGGAALLAIGVAIVVIRRRSAA